jgi:hypothetical protein
MFLNRQSGYQNWTMFCVSFDRGKRGQADLLLRNGQFYLCVAVTIAEAPRFLPEGMIGINLDIVNIATEILCAERKELGYPQGLPMRMPPSTSLNLQTD